MAHVVGVLVVGVLATALLVASAWNPNIYAPDGQTYEQHIAEGQALIAEARDYAIVHCGQLYMPSCEGWR